MKYEYKVFNLSEAKDEKNWLYALNHHGAQGWELVFQLTRQSYLLKRAIPCDSSASKAPDQAPPSGS